MTRITDRCSLPGFEFTQSFEYGYTVTMTALRFQLEGKRYIDSGGCDQ